MFSKIVCFLLIVVLIKKAIAYKLIDLTEEKYNNRLSPSEFPNGKSYDVGIYLKKSLLKFLIPKKEIITENCACVSILEKGKLVWMASILSAIKTAITKSIFNTGWCDSTF